MAGRTERSAYDARPVLVATAVWHIRPELILAADDRLGSPVDSYLNGSQTWFTEIPPPGEGRPGVELEWRLHPVAGYRLPRGISHYDLWETVVDQLAGGTDPGALVLGAETRALEVVWDGLECFAAHGDELEPATLASAATSELGLAPDAAGLVDHDRIGDAWERSQGAVSIVGLLLAQLQG